MVRLFRFHNLDTATAKDLSPQVLVAKPPLVFCSRTQYKGPAGFEFMKTSQTRKPLSNNAITASLLPMFSHTVNGSYQAVRTSRAKPPRSTPRIIILPPCSYLSISGAVNGRYWSSKTVTLKIRPLCRTMMCRGLFLGATKNKNLLYELY